jgi:hypothetical protein
MTTIQEALQAMYDVGTRQIDVYYTGMIEDDETDWQVDVMCDPINDMCESSWTWTVTSVEEFIKVIEEDEFFISEDWVVITNRPFSENTVRESIREWLLANGFDMGVQMIDVDDATGSGYVRELRNIDMEKQEQNAVPPDRING